eukprot:NODE_5477_length_1766_cov_3.338011.p1 GENE.NODE_5477_length_1766_cov_3.338011~~NODE_5477_length_1766_cov_3.338011.p1  ORF type:complete len:520 (+),score=98.24 NODE_5477_length_1766_cov_3.338011:127-1560(+)
MATAATPPEGGGATWRLSRDLGVAGRPSSGRSGKAEAHTAAPTTAYSPRLHAMATARAVQARKRSDSQPPGIVADETPQTLLDVPTPARASPVMTSRSPAVSQAGSDKPVAAAAAAAAAAATAAAAAATPNAGSATASGANTPGAAMGTGGSISLTLHSEFAGLRDEMKRRRSSRAIGSGTIAADAAEDPNLTPNDGGEPQHRHMLGLSSTVPSMRTGTVVATERGEVAHPALSTVVGGACVPEPVVPSLVPAGGYCGGAVSTPCSPVIDDVLLGHAVPAVLQRGTGNNHEQAPSITGNRGGSTSLLVGGSGVPLAKQQPLQQPQQPLQQQQPQPRASLSSSAICRPSEARQSLGVADGQMVSVTARGPVQSQVQQQQPSVRGRTAAQEHDPIHEAVVKFSVNRPSGRFPLVKSSKGVYSYGNKTLIVAIHNDKLMVRIGGGFVLLEAYLLDVDRAAIVAAPTTPAPRRSISSTKPS